MHIPFEKHVLGNGLRVVIHEDHSDPVVSVSVDYHVGSSREHPSRTGFAHLFEHLLFEGSQHVEEGEHFRRIQEAGGTLNGSTSHDRTNYYETLPSNHLELALWLEADRMGFLLPGVTQAKLDNQRDVVKNERRQSYENQPYGLVSETVARHLYPPTHPYAWDPIGSMAHLDAATLEDVHGFFARWYGPDNATLAIGGDVNPLEVMDLVHRYFGDIPRGPGVARPTPAAAGLHGTKRLILEDTIKVPQLTMVFPTVSAWHEDEPAVTILAEVLSANKSALIDKALTVDASLASHVTIGPYSLERAGALWLNLRPHDGVSLSDLERRCRDIFHTVVETGVSDEHIERLLARREGYLLRALDTVSSRTSVLAHYECMRGDPGLLQADLERHQRVTAAQVRSAARRYLDDRPGVILSVVPKGSLEVAAADSLLESEYRPSTLDRSLRPTARPLPEVRLPTLRHRRLPNGLDLLMGATSALPVTSVQFTLPRGRTAETIEQAGVAHLLVTLLEEGTEELSTVAMQDALDAMGAVLEVDAGDTELTWSLSTLDRHLPRALRLLEDTVLRPRLAQDDFERCQRQRLVEIRMRQHSARALAADGFTAALYGPGTVAGTCPLGTVKSISGLDRGALCEFFRAGLVGEAGALTAMSAVEPQVLLEGLPGLSALPTSARPQRTTNPSVRRSALRGVFLIHRVGPQSEVRIGHPSVDALHADYFLLHAANFALGGSFTSRINLNLREDKGYTYGANSSFSANAHRGAFTVSTAVHTEVTGAAVQELLNELYRYMDGPTNEEIGFTRQSLMQSMVRQYDSPSARLAYASNVQRFGWPLDYPLQRYRMLDGLTPDTVRAALGRHLRLDEATILVVGDRDLIRGQLEGLDRGPVVEIGSDGVTNSGG